jgi:hypothetical protein
MKPLVLSHPNSAQRLRSWSLLNQSRFMGRENHHIVTPPPLGKQEDERKEECQNHSDRIGPAAFDDIGENRRRGEPAKDPSSLLMKTDCITHSVKRHVIGFFSCPGDRPTDCHEITVSP